jgi:manganese-dependent inorganic pyrophosphatase
MKDDLIADIASLKDEEGFDTVLLLLTDIMAMGSQILVSTNSLDNVQKAWNVEVKDNQFYLDGCLSRKKQVIPFLEPTFK